MRFSELSEKRYSCRKYDTQKTVEWEKIEAVLKAGILSPSACNGQPYHFTVCRGELLKKVAKTTKAMGLNSFVDKADTLIIISEKPYSRLASVGAKVKGNDYRSIDIGIAAAHMTLEATEQGLGSCIIGWLDSEEIEKMCDIDGKVRLIITLGYPLDSAGAKKRKDFSQMVTVKE